MYKEIIEANYVKFDNYDEILFVEEFDQKDQMILLEDGRKYRMMTYELAQELARDEWEHMYRYDISEFKAIIGEVRLVHWGLGEADDFGISSLDEFLDVIEANPEEILSRYDGQINYITLISKELKEEFAFGGSDEIVAFRE